MRLFKLFCLLIIFANCKDKQQPLTATTIIDKAIALQCATNCDAVTIDFTFRDKEYQSTRKDGVYSLQRSYQDSIGRVVDVVTNNSFVRTVDAKKVQVTDSLSRVLSDAVNSVHYFAQLPYGLQAAAVQKKQIGEGTVKGEPYYKIQVTFSEEGGGTDYEDVFLYWIHKQNFTIDYLAYSYAVNGGGIRFREAYNPRVVEGVRFVDYNNYKPSSLNVSLEDLDILFEKQELQLLSKIETEKIKVTLLYN